MVLTPMERHINKISLFCALIIIFSFSMFGCAAWEESIAQYGDDQMYGWIDQMKKDNWADIQKFREYIGKTKDEIYRDLGEPKEKSYESRFLVNPMCQGLDTFDHSCADYRVAEEVWTYRKFPNKKELKVSSFVDLYFIDGRVFAIKNFYTLVDGSEWDGKGRESKSVIVVK